jgi:hypothetical protein
MINCNAVAVKILSVHSRAQKIWNHLKNSINIAHPPTIVPVAKMPFTVFKLKFFKLFIHFLKLKKLQLKKIAPKVMFF